MGSEKAPVWRHQMTLIDREELSVEGVASLGSYDEKEVSLETEQGMMMVRGDGLSVKQLNLEEGKIVIIGNVKSIQYEEVHKERRGLLDRLLK